MITRHAHYLMHWVTFGHFALVVIETETLLYIQCISVWHYGLEVWIRSIAMRGTLRERNSECRILPVMKKKAISLSNAEHIKQITTRMNRLIQLVFHQFIQLFIFTDVFFFYQTSSPDMLSLSTHTGYKLFLLA